MSQLEKILKVVVRSLKASLSHFLLLGFLNIVLLPRKLGKEKHYNRFSLSDTLPLQSAIVFSSAWVSLSDWFSGLGDDHSKHA